MCHPRFGLDSPIATSSSGARYGKGRSSRARMQLKIVALTPMPSVRQRTAAMENAGLLASVRRAKRKSASMIRMEEDLGSDNRVCSVVGTRVWQNVHNFVRADFRDPL